MLSSDYASDLIEFEGAGDFDFYVFIDFVSKSFKINLKSRNFNDFYLFASILTSRASDMTRFGVTVSLKVIPLWLNSTLNFLKFGKV